MQDNNLVGQRIRAARIAKGLKQTQLAAKAGISNSTLSDIERGYLDPKLNSQALALCRVLGIDLNYLVGLSTDDLTGMIDKGQLNLDSWLKFGELNYELKREVYHAINLLHRLQNGQTKK